MKNKHSFLLGLMASIFIGVCLGGCGTPCEESPQGCLDELDPSGQNISYWYQHSRDRGGAAIFVDEATQRAGFNCFHAHCEELRWKEIRRSVTSGAQRRPPALRKADTKKAG